MITRTRAMAFMNQPVILDMADGTTRRGIIHTVTNEGLYLRPMNGARLAKDDLISENDIQVLMQSHEDIKDVEGAFFPFFFFPFFFVRRIRPFFFF